MATDPRALTVVSDLRRFRASSYLVKVPRILYQVLCALADDDDDELLCLVVFDTRISSATLNAVFRELLFQRHWPLVELMLENPRVNPTQGVLLKEAAASNRVELVHRLLDDERCATQRHHLLTGAVLGDRVELVKFLLSDPRIDATSQVLQLACQYRASVEVVQLLLADPRIDPSQCYPPAICTAASNCGTDVVDLLLADPRVDPTVCTNEPLYKAVKHNDVAMTRRLLQDPRVNATVPLLRVIGYHPMLSEAACLALADERTDSARVHKDMQKKWGPDALASVLGECAARGFL